MIVYVGTRRAVHLVISLGLRPGLLWPGGICWPCTRARGSSGGGGGGGVVRLILSAAALRLPVQQGEDVGEAGPRPVHVLLQHLEQVSGFVGSGTRLFVGVGPHTRNGKPSR